MELEYPLVSCICVTRKKPLMLEKAIRCFFAQSYSNKELIIVYEDDDRATDQFVNGMPPSALVKAVKIKKDEETRLGMLRNLGIKAASGVYVCQWDDDDWFHSERLKYQYMAISNPTYAGSILMTWLVFNAKTGKAYFSFNRTWEGSIFCKREVLLNEKRYENVSAGEDTPVVDYIFSRGILQPIDWIPHLYIYVYHGHNTYNYEHWNRIFDLSTLLPYNINSEVAKIITQDYDVAEGSMILDKIAVKYIA